MGSLPLVPPGKPKDLKEEHFYQVSTKMHGQSTSMSGGAWNLH